jgi:hypothetical protein
VHVVREERLAGGSVRAGDDPVIRARIASIARGFFEGVMEGD